MPSAYQGSVTAPSTVPWSSGLAVTAGTTQITPTANTGQYFLVTNSGSGTTSSTEPSWSTVAALPVPGQTFTDSNGVVFTCQGSLINAVNIVVDLPDDSDPSLTAVIVRGMKTLANFAQQAVNLLITNNTWTGTNTFDNNVAVVGAAASTALAVTSNGGSAVVGTSTAGNHSGVVGAGSGTSAGVNGTGGSSNGPGVSGQGTGSGAGVFGTGGATANTAGVAGLGGSGGGDGVTGTPTGSGYFGVHGLPNANGAGGVCGDSNGTIRPGVVCKGTSGTIAPLRIVGLAAAPSTANPGDIYYDSTANHFYGCLSANTWTTII